MEVEKPAEKVVSLYQYFTPDEKVEILFRKYYASLCKSLYKILRQEFGATPFKAKDTYTPELARGMVAEALAIAEGTPVFRVERVALDQVKSYLAGKLVR